jgi:hypothetical protein
MLNLYCLLTLVMVDESYVRRLDEKGSLTQSHCSPVAFLKAISCALKRVSLTFKTVHHAPQNIKGVKMRPTHHASLSAVALLQVFRLPSILWKTYIRFAYNVFDSDHRF